MHLRRQKAPAGLHSVCVDALISDTSPLLMGLQLTVDPLTVTDEGSVEVSVHVTGTGEIITARVIVHE